MQKEYIISTTRLHNLITSTSNNNNNLFDKILVTNIFTGTIKLNKLSHIELAQSIFNTAKNSFLPSSSRKKSVKSFLKYLSKTEADRKSTKKINKYKKSFSADKNNVYKVIISLTNNPEEDIEMLVEELIQAYVQYMEYNADKPQDRIDGVIYQKSLNILVTLSDENIMIEVNNDFSFKSSMDFKVKREIYAKTNTFLDLL